MHNVEMDVRRDGRVGVKLVEVLGIEPRSKKLPHAVLLPVEASATPMRLAKGE